MKFTTFSLTELLSQIGEDKVRNKLKGFRSKDKDIENFLINKAIFFEKISISSTYLIFNYEKELAGYFSIANRSLILQKEDLDIISKTLKKRLTKSASENKSGDYVINSFLLGQVGKNFNLEKNNLTGNEILKIAYELLLEIRQKIRVKFIWLECQNNEKILNFYQNFGFSKIDNFISESGYNVMIMELK